MSSILDKFAIKEVADVWFYELDNAGNPTVPALYLDTCTVSNLEQTADESEIRGGKGNAKLMSFDSNKDLSVTLEDALFSAKSMAILYGTGTLKSYSSGDGTNINIMRTEEISIKYDLAGSEATAALVIPTQGTDHPFWKKNYEGPDGKVYPKLNPKLFTADGKPIAQEGDTQAGVVGWTTGSGGSEALNTALGEKVFVTYDLAVATGSVVEITPDSFPGTYYVVMSTYARDYGSGKDDFFDLVLPKCKVRAENTIEMSAGGDASTVNFNLSVQKPSNGMPMVSMVKYNLNNGSDPAAAGSIASGIVHNHNIKGTGNVPVSG